MGLHVTVSDSLDCVAVACGAGVFVYDINNLGKIFSFTTEDLEIPVTRYERLVLTSSNFGYVQIQQKI
jgi:hypothetical protein